MINNFEEEFIKCVQTFYSGHGEDASINELLSIIASFHGADRAYIFEVSDDASAINNTYEWCRAGVKPQIDMLQNIDISVIDRWIVQFEEKGEFFINSLNGELSSDSEEYRILAAQDVESLMAAPLMMDGRLAGFIGVDNPKENTDNLLLLKAVTAFAVNDIQKRETLEQRIVSAISKIYVCMNLYNIPEDTQREFHSDKAIKEFVKGKNNAAAEMRNAVEALTAEEYVDEVLAFTDLSTLSERMSGTNIISCEFVNGDGHWCRSNFIAVSHDEEGRLVQVIYAVQFIDKEKQRELKYQRALDKALRNQNEIYTEILQMQGNGVVAASVGEDKILMINDAVVKMFGLGGKKKKDITVDDLSARIVSEQKNEYLLRMKNLKEVGEEYSCEYVIENGSSTVYVMSSAKVVSLANGDRICLISMTDITENKKLEQKLWLLSQTDSLTKISNRGSGERQIEQMLEDGVNGMFCLFDVDKFKLVNDMFGHTVGDKVLVEIAGCLERSFSGDSVIMRLGGDEFAVYEAYIKSEAEGAAYIDRFFKEVETIRIPEMNGRGISVSLGAVLYRQNEDVRFDELYQMADAAMYICKNKNGNYFEFYHPV